MVNKMQTLSRFWCSFISIFFLTTLLAFPVMAEIAPAGITITNRAEISWFDTADGFVKKLYSNVFVCLFLIPFIFLCIHLKVILHYSFIIYGVQ